MINGNLNTEAGIGAYPNLTNMKALFEQHEHAPDPVWVLDGLLRSNRGRPSLLCGYPHAGKSTIARQLAITVSKGGWFLGRKATCGPVLYWCSEDSSLDTARDFKKQGADANDMITVMRSDSPKVETRLMELQQALSSASEEGHPYSLVIVETICDLLQPENENDNAEVGELMTRFINDIVHVWDNASFLMLHHFNKSSDAAVMNNGLLRVSGARAFVSKSDAKWFMYQMSDNEPARVFSTKVRTGWDIEPTYLQFDTTDNTSTLGKRVADVAVTAKESQKLQRQMLLQQNILKLVAGKEGKGIPKSLIRGCVGGKAEVVVATIDRLIEEGHLKAMKHKNKTHIFTAEQAQNGEMTAEVCESWTELAEEDAPNA
jgi:hypothetical protein